MSLLTSDQIKVAAAAAATASNAGSVDACIGILKSVKSCDDRDSILNLAMTQAIDKTALQQVASAKDRFLGECLGDGASCGTGLSTGAVVAIGVGAGVGGLLLGWLASRK